MTRRYEVRTHQRGRPSKGLTALRAAYDNKSYTLALLPRDLAAVRQQAAFLNAPGRQTFLDALIIAELREVLPAVELMGNRINIAFDTLEAAHVPFQKFKVWSVVFARSLQDCVSSFIYQVFGDPPEKPENINESLWAAWAYTPWAKDHPEITWEAFEYISSRRKS